MKGRTLTIRLQADWKWPCARPVQRQRREATRARR